MSDLFALSEIEDKDLVPEILPVDARLSIATQASVLTALLNSAHDITPAKEIIPLTSYVRLEAYEGGMSVASTDGERSIRVDSRVVVVKLAGATLLPGKRMLDILKLVPEETVLIDVIGTSATIRSGRAVWRVETPPVDASFARSEELKDVQWLELDRAAFLSALELILPAVSRTTARQSLMQAEIDKGLITSCDGARAHRVKLGTPKSFKTTLPIKFIETAIKELKSCRDEMCYLTSDNDSVALRLGSTRIRSQRLNYPFPPINQLVLGPALSNDEKLYVNRNELVAAVRRVRVNADPEYSALFLTVAKERGEWRLTIRARDRLGNASQESIKADYVGPANSKELVVNHRYLLEFLHCIEYEHAELRLGESTKTKQAPIYYESDEFTGSLMVMAPNFVR